jgi:hypothetical protein
MTTPLRPMSTGEVLDRTFHLYRNHFWLFVGIGSGYGLCLLIGVLILVSLGILGPLGNGPDFTNGLQILLAEFVVALFGLFGYAVASGPTYFAVSRVHFGQPANVRESYSAVGSLTFRFLRIQLSVFLRCFGALLLAEFLVGVAMTFVLIPLSRSIANASPMLVGLIMAILAFGSMASGLVWAIRIFCRNSLAVPACLLERLPARQALKRSRWLTKKSLGRHFLVFLLTGILVVALFYAFLIPGVLAAGKVPTVVLIGWQALAAFAALALSFPIGTIATSLLYYDQRVRKEAFDLQFMMDSIAQPLPEKAQAGSVAGL